MAITVRDCPFCGSGNVEIDEVTVGEYAVGCNECQALGPICSDVMTTIRAWNERNPPQWQPAQ